MDKTDDVAPLGHNLPSPLDLEWLKESLAAESVELMATFRQIQQEYAEQPLRIENDEQQGVAGDLRKKMRTLRAALGTQHDGLKRPYLNAGGLIDGHYKKPTEETAKMEAALNHRQTIYGREKEEAERRRRELEAQRAREEADRKRREAEETERRRQEEERRRRAEVEAREKAIKDQKDLDAAIAAEAEEKRRREEEAAEAERKRKEAEQAEAARVAAEMAANAKAADLTRVRGDYGSVSSLVTFWTFELLDRAKLNYAALGPYFTEEAIKAALRAATKAGVRDVGEEGARIFKDTKNR